MGAAGKLGSPPNPAAKASYINCARLHQRYGHSSSLSFTSWRLWVEMSLATDFKQVGSAIT